MRRQVCNNRMVFDLLQLGLDVYHISMPVTSPQNSRYPDLAALNSAGYIAPFFKIPGPYLLLEKLSYEVDTTNQLLVQELLVQAWSITISVKFSCQHPDSAHPRHFHSSPSFGTPLFQFANTAISIKGTVDLHRADPTILCVWFDICTAPIAYAIVLPVIS